MSTLFEKTILEMAATLTDASPVKRAIQDIKTKNLPHHYQKPLVAISSESDVNQAIDKVLNKVFGSENYNSDINTKKELQAALEKAVLEVSKDSASKFKRPVVGVAANYLGRWLGTNIGVEFSQSELQAKGASKQKAKKVLQAVLTPSSEAPSKPLTATKPEEPEQRTEEEISSQSLSSVFDEVHTTTAAGYEFLQSKIAKSNKRGGRYGLPQVTLDVVNKKAVTVKGKHDISYPVTVELVEFKINVPQLTLPGNWKFIASVDHLGGDGNIINVAPNSGYEKNNLHELFGKSQASTCDHCGKVRRRTQTFVVQDDKGNLKRVGRACLKDYLPGGERTAYKLILWAKYIADLALGIVEAESYGEGDDGDYGPEGGYGGGKRVEIYNIENVLAAGLYVVDTLGYTSKAKAQETDRSPTSSIVSSALNQREVEQAEDKINRGYGNANDRAIVGWKNLEKDEKQSYVQKAQDIVQWAEPYVSREANNPNNRMLDFFKNLEVILKNKYNTEEPDKRETYVGKKHVGYVVALLPMFYKAVTQTQQAKAAAKDQGNKLNEFVGEVGLPIGKLSAIDRTKVRKAKGKDFDFSQFPYNGPIKLKAITDTRSFERQAYSRYDSGLSYLTNFEDEQGRRYVWFSTQEVEYTGGSTYTLIRATVKNQKEYQNPKTGEVVKQTYISRPTFGETDEAASKNPF